MTTHEIDQTFLLGGDLRVNRIGYGTMRLSDDPRTRPADQAHIWRTPADRASAITLLRRAVELGVTLIDTADSYALGGNEELVAEALHPFPGVAVATKVGVVRPSPAEWVPLGRPEYLRQQTELSLRRLRVERIDLLQLHRIDPTVPLADQIGALHRLREEGKVRHIGLSEVTVAELTAAAAITPIAAVQNLYNLAARGHDDVVDHAAREGIAFLPFFPIAMGGHAGAGSPVAEIAADLGASPAQMALAWLLHRSPTIIPIPGTTSIGHLEENVAALEVRLSAEQFARIR
ncbi:aldo/keto reductase [Nonomuraea soli]|uniref:Aryl-alcohol dehydrogenase-like predicted oxidoreductase n=1 Tax=Nonomuraea soli TaxID=1032476 RepID=A0A7W0CDX5_9ACTN|nr:aldo/keto reductase [Nonomuraea soli]MBA2889383.1 aryl-alcohol dehydrogenase-like predicted oxidoreductase [Nonomuraea soli]